MTSNGNLACVHDDVELERLAEAAPLFIPAGVGTILSTVKPEQVEWLWPGWIPKGKITLLDGDPGLSKSGVSLDLAARISTGRPMPGLTERRPAAGVVLLSAEDGLADTIQPRLEAAGADLDRISSISMVPHSNGERLAVIPNDLALIEAEIKRMGAVLLVIDPLMAFLDSACNSFRDQHVRQALAPVAAMAEQLGVAVLVIRHLNKNAGGSALYRGGGSIGIIGAARSALVIAKDPEDEERRVIASTKCNLSATPDSISYHVEEADSGALRIIWGGTSPLMADDLLAIPREKKPQAISKATDFLLDALERGPRYKVEVEKEAQERGISTATLRRASTALAVSKTKDGFQGASMWSLPDVITGQTCSPALKDAQY